VKAAFAEGVPELAGIARPRPAPPYKGALGRCWLAQHDERRRPCKGPLERFHFLRRGTVEDTLRAALPTAGYYPTLPDDTITAMMDGFDRGALVYIAAWDPRNAEVGCEGHHRRYDNHATPPLPIGYHQVPNRVIEFALDWGLERAFEDRFGAALIGLDVDPQPSPPTHRLHPVSTLPTT
jgi:hypothetical protein